MSQHLILHGLAIKKHSSAKTLAPLLGLSETAIAAGLERAVESGRAMAAQEGFLLTPLGRMIVENNYSLSFAALRSDPGLGDAYEQFERLNVVLKQLITDWQTMTVGGQQVPNDHSDPVHDQKTLDRLGDLHEAITPVLERLGGAEPRMRYYLEKLGQALDKADDGGTEWISDVHIDSYHTVWFEMHEDLLRIFGRKREE